MEKVQRHLVIVNGRIRKSDKYLIAQRALDDNYSPGHWSIVGGKVDAIEGKDTLQANLKKEILEEVGLEINDEMTLIGNEMEVSSENKTVLYLTFLCERKSWEAKALEDTNAIRRVTREEIQTFDESNILHMRKEYLPKK